MAITSPKQGSREPSNTKYEPSPSAEPVASTSASADSDSSNAAERPKPTLVRNRRPTQAYLERMGIKVRDFAYEKTTLPPVRTIYGHPKQTQPAVNRPVQRQSTEPEETIFSQESQTAEHVETTPTEPAMTPAATRNNDAFWGVGYIEKMGDLKTFGTQQSAGSQMPAAIFDSQAAGATINTPHVTPNGSLQWDIESTSNIPVSQLDTFSQAVEHDVFSYSQLGFSHPAEYSQQSTVASTSHIATPTPSSPLTPLPSSNQSSQANVLKTPTPNFSRSQPSRLANRRTNSIHDLHSPKKTTNRYDLRKRPSPASPIITKPAKRMKIAENPTRPRTGTLRLMHLQKKTSGGSPSSRVLRQPGTTCGRGKGKGKAKVI